eukprot:365277-Chlamydomonas_euryale.AAC.28
MKSSSESLRSHIAAAAAPSTAALLRAATACGADARRLMPRPEGRRGQPKRLRGRCVAHMRPPRAACTPPLPSPWRRSAATSRGACRCQTVPPRPPPSLQPAATPLLRRSTPRRRPALRRVPRKPSTRRCPRPALAKQSACNRPMAPAKRAGRVVPPAVLYCHASASVVRPPLPAGSLWMQRSSRRCQHRRRRAPLLPRPMPTTQQPKQWQDQQPPPRLPEQWQQQQAGHSNPYCLAIRAAPVCARARAARTRTRAHWPGGRARAAAAIAARCASLAATACAAICRGVRGAACISRCTLSAIRGGGDAVRSSNGDAAWSSNGDAARSSNGDAAGSSAAPAEACLLEQGAVTVPPCCVGDASLQAAQTAPLPTAPLQTAPLPTAPLPTALLPAPVSRQRASAPSAAGLMPSPPGMPSDGGSGTAGTVGTIGTVVAGGTVEAVEAGGADHAWLHAHPPC